jgi:MerR-like DNA binding protein
MARMDSSRATTALQHIGEVSRQLGVSPEHLRTLERQGRIPPARRDFNGRIYTPFDIELLRSMGVSGSKQITVTRDYRPEPGYCARALQVVLNQPARKMAAEPAPELDDRSDGTEIKKEDSADAPIIRQ